MADPTYQDKVYMKQGAEELVVANGGAINIEPGGKMQRNGTDTITSFSLEGSTTSIADSLAIPVTAAYVAKTTGADAEALTLADGVPGQILTVSLVVDGGGDGTLTPATSSGWATMVFADAGDTGTFFFPDTTIGWVVLGTTGVAAPPVISV